MRSKKDERRARALERKRADLVRYQFPEVLWASWEKDVAKLKAEIVSLEERLGLTPPKALKLMGA